jgi:hypothetical protein
MMKLLPRHTSGLDENASRGIARLHLIPDHCRSFTIDARRAELEFGVDAGLAQKLMSAGMPHARTDGEAWFNATDLHYIALRLGCAEIYLDAMQRWSHALDISARSDTVQVEIHCVPYTYPGATVRVLGPQGWISAVVGPDRTAASFTLHITGQWPALDPSLNTLLIDMALLDFCRLPEPLNTCTNFIRETRLADCAGASRLLVQECRSRGVPARTAYGLLIASPYSTPHNWAEIKIGVDWIPVDPLLLALLAQYTKLDPTTWPPTRCPGGVLLRLAEQEAPIVLTDGGALDATFLTTIRPVLGDHPAVERQRSAL